MTPSAGLADLAQTATLRSALIAVARSLAGERIPDAQLEAELLVATVLNFGRAALYARTNERLTPDQCSRLGELRDRRLKREPLAYILGRREFWGLELLVNRNVLIPRPETELLVDITLRLARERPSAPLILADIGTGCGAIAIALACSLPDCRVHATDISTAALQVARRNAERHRVADRVQFLAGDLLDPLAEQVDLLVANLPYIPSADVAGLQPEVSRFEPRVALDGGSDGLDLLRRLLAQAPGRLRRSGALVLEIGAGQGRSALALAATSFPKCTVRVVPDHAGLDRVLMVDLAGPALGRRPQLAESSGREYNAPHSAP